MSRSSSERVSEEDKLREEFMERYAMPMGDIPKIGAEEMFNWFIARMKTYTNQKIKQIFEEENRNEGDRFMPCSQCKKEFEWNGKDKGELIRVRGGGMWCRSCLGGPYNV